jgi:hypothetical protein
MSRSKNIRPKGYQNLMEWMKDDKNVYIGRKGIVFIDKVRFPKNSSIFCNPYKVGKDGTRGECLKKYKTHLKTLMKDASFKAKMKNLKGKNLGCWCKPEKCHGDVLLKYVEKL